MPGCGASVMNTQTKPDQDGATAIPVPDHAAIRSHVELLHTLAKGAGVEGILAFTRIDANNKTHTERFAIGDVDHMADAIIGWSTHPDLNIYASYAIFRKDLPPGAAGGEADVRAVLALVGDLDSDIGKKAVSLDGLPLRAAVCRRDICKQLPCGVSAWACIVAVRRKAHSSGVKQRHRRRQRHKRRFAPVAHPRHTQLAVSQEAWARTAQDAAAGDDQVSMDRRNG